MKDVFPTTFPSGQGSDFAGVVAETGAGVDGFSAGDEVIGFSEKRASHAEFVVVPAENLIAKPAAVPWEVAGALYVAGTSAYAAVRAVDLTQGDVVAVAGAAGGVGSIAVQLAAQSGATVLGIAGPSNDEWLRAHGVIPVNYGDDLAERLRAAAPEGRIDAFLDFFGGGYVELAVDELGVAPERVNTIIDFAAAEQFKVRTSGNADAANADRAGRTRGTGRRRPTGRAHRRGIRARRRPERVPDARAAPYAREAGAPPVAAASAGREVPLPRGTCRWPGR